MSKVLGYLKSAYGYIGTYKAYWIPVAAYLAGSHGLLSKLAKLVLAHVK